jgi:hypothetical protein
LRHFWTRAPICFALAMFVRVPPAAGRTRLARLRLTDPLGILHSGARELEHGRLVGDRPRDVDTPTAAQRQRPIVLANRSPLSFVDLPERDDVEVTLAVDET